MGKYVGKMSWIAGRSCRHELNTSGRRLVKDTSHTAMRRDRRDLDEQRDDMLVARRGAVRGFDGLFVAREVRA